jgi:hypothetical protein
VSVDDARHSAQRVANAIVNSKAKSLEGHGLSEIQTWTDKDESIVSAVRKILVTAGDIPDLGQNRVFAAHIVAAAVIEALANGTDLPLIFDRMIAILARMKDKNPVWGPLFVRHPGNISRDLAYVKRPVVGWEL